MLSALREVPSSKAFLERHPEFRDVRGASWSGVRYGRARTRWFCAALAALAAEWYRRSWQAPALIKDNAEPSAGTSQRVIGRANACGTNSLEMFGFCAHVWSGSRVLSCQLQRADAQNRLAMKVRTPTSRWLESNLPQHLPTRCQGCRPQHLERRRHAEEGGGLRKSRNLACVSCAVAVT